MAEPTTTDLLLICPRCTTEDLEDNEEGYCTHLGLPYCELFVLDEDRHPSGRCGFICSVCGRDVGGRPCPDHAPTSAPGFRLIECDANPRHVTLIHDRDDYGAPCPWCLLDGYYERERLAQQCRHSPLRRWRLLGQTRRWRWSR